MRLPFLLIILLLALLLVAACGNGGGEEEGVFLQDPEAALLQISEVPSRFVEIEGSRRHISNEESCAGTEGTEREECLSQREQWGRLDGIEVAYRADDPTAFLDGVYRVFSATTVYRDPKGARDSFSHNLERLKKDLAGLEDAPQVDAATLVEIEPVGEESVAFAINTFENLGGDDIPVTLYVVDFRRGNTLAQVGVIAPTALASVDPVLALAKRVDQRILRVASPTAPPVSPTAAATATPATTTTPTTAATETATATATATAPP